MITFTAANCKGTLGEKPAKIRIVHNRIHFSSAAVKLLDLKPKDRLCFTLFPEDETIYFYKDPAGLPLSIGTGAKLKHGIRLVIHSKILASSLLRHLKLTSITIEINEFQQTALGEKNVWFLLKKRVRKVA